MEAMKTKILHYLKVWIPLATVVTLMSGMVSFAVLENFRASANDPQIQISEDISTALANGAVASQLNQNNKVDISKSLSTFIIIYDKDGMPVASTGILDGDVPRPPAGVFEYVREHGENSITWEPQDDVRSAIIIRPYSSGETSGFVLVGRSLREVENRIKALGKHVLLGWAVSLFVTMLSIIATDLFFMWIHRSKPAVPAESSPETPSVDL